MPTQVQSELPLPTKLTGSVGTKHKEIFTHELALRNKTVSVKVRCRKEEGSRGKSTDTQRRKESNRKPKSSLHVNSEGRI